MTGYCDAPAGVIVREGQYYNPYFPGGAISMAQALYDETIQYSDGTPASASQLAKDVCHFLNWTSDPYLEDRKLVALRLIVVLTFSLVITYYYKRFKWSVIKSRKIEFIPKKK